MSPHPSETRLTWRPLALIACVVAAFVVWLGYSISVSAPSPAAADPPAATLPPNMVFQPIGERFVNAPNFNALLYAPSGPYAPPLTSPVSRAGGAGSLAPAADPSCPANAVGLQLICHIVIIMQENQSFDREFATFQNSNGMAVDGLPTVGAPGTFVACLPDPRQTEAPAGVVLPCQRPYHVPYTPIAGNPSPPAAQTSEAYYQQQQNLNDNPHDAASALTDIAGVPPTVGLTPGLTPTPMTGYLASAWSYCLTPGPHTGYYNLLNRACNTPTPGAGVPTATPYPPGVPTATLVPFDVMRYLDGNDLPYYWWFASNYVLQDHMFEPVKSYSLPSHLFQVSNWSAACPLTDTSTMAVISGTPTACTNQPSTPPAILNQPSYFPQGQYYPNYAWTDITYLLDHHQAYANAAGTPVPTVAGAFCGTDIYGNSGVYINPQATPIATVAGASCQAAPIDWAYYRAFNTKEDCPGYGATATPHLYSCNPQEQPYSGTVEYWNPLQFFTTVHFDGTPGPGTPTPLPNNQGQLGNIQPMGNYFNAVAAGQLPKVSWIVPPIDNSDHPPFTLDYGQLFVTSIIDYTATQDPAQWAHTAFILAWDDWGGFYDHEPPPAIPPSGPPDTNGYGLRVPSIIISPYARHCYSDQQPMSFDAYNKLIEADFLSGQTIDPKTDGRADPRGTAQPVPRETALPSGSDIANDFDFTQTSFSDNIDPPPAYATPSAAWCSS